jgi:hypothetical protein
MQVNDGFCLEATKAVRLSFFEMRLTTFVAVLLLLVSCASTSKRIHSMSTAELKLRRTQLAEEIAQPMGWRFSGFRPGTEGHEDQLKEKQKIEFELLRRWQAGDKEAYLPQFSR